MGRPEMVVFPYYFLEKRCISCRIMLVLLTTTEHGLSDLEIGDSQHTTRKLLGEAVADTLIPILRIIG